MPHSLRSSFSSLLSTGVALFALSRPVPPPRKVKLAVLVVFDQMRGDYLERWRPLFGDGGFARLQRDGAWFTNCHYPYAHHHHRPRATRRCSPVPAADSHGIVNNNWIGERHRASTAPATRGTSSLPCRSPTRSPRRRTRRRKPAAVGTPERLLSETVADVLKEATGGKAKVFGLSLKDRSAILPTGKRPDGAYWFDNGAFVTSTYYARRVHPWVEAFNTRRPREPLVRPGLDAVPPGPRLRRTGAAGRRARRGEGPRRRA